MDVLSKERYGVGLKTGKTGAWGVTGILVAGNSRFKPEFKFDGFCCGYLAHYIFEKCTNMNVKMVTCWLKVCTYCGRPLLVV